MPNQIIMKTKIFLFALFLTLSQFAFAQKVKLTGVVRSEGGESLSYAFLLDKTTGVAVYADTLGIYSLPLTDSSKVEVSCDGYINTDIDPAGHKTLDIVLKKDPAYVKPAMVIAKTKDMEVMNESFKRHVEVHPGSSYGYNNAVVYSTIVQINGSRFLFPKWVHGYIVRPRGQIVQGQSMLFNYDKMDGDLYYTTDLAKVNVADKNQIRGFVLFDQQNKPYTFEMMTGISTVLYSRVISAGAKYKIYKLTNTQYEPANLRSDGVVTTGHEDDEYVDHDVYYIQNLSTYNYQPLLLSKKALKAAFADEGDKVTGFLESHKGEIDENYLVSLGEAMNN